jgi:superfamily II RNA helicase
MPVETFKGFVLNPFQRRAVESIRLGRSVLVSAPTGAGKTLVAEYAVHDALARGRRAIYTAPIKALSNQKYRDFRADPEVDVGIMTGDVTIHPGARLLLMTTEILRNTIFDDPERLEDVDFVVFDEIHYMDDLERGTVWEETILFAPASIRFVGLSATISNLEEFADWLRSVRTQELEVVASKKRPVPLRHFLFHPSMGVLKVEDRRRALSRSRSHLRNGYRGGRESKRLLDDLQKKGGLPALCFCFSRREVERRAQGNAFRDLLTAEERARAETLVDEICATFQIEATPELEELRRLARRGIAYHHAGMLPLHKELVERLFTSGLIRLLFATETFALGINMPARSVVFHSLRKFDGISFGYLGARDYWQMAGRAGRQGIDDEGLVFTVIDARDLREAPFDRLFSGTVEPIRSRFNLSYSTLLNLHERLGERIFEAWERSFNAFQFRDLGPRKADKNREKQLRLLHAKLDLLHELHYLDAAGILDRGSIARRINGYELQWTEMLFEGVLDPMPPVALAATAAALVYEERPGDEFGRLDPRLLGVHRERADAIVQRLMALEGKHGIPDSIRTPSWRLAPVLDAWMSGKHLEELGEFANVPAGDLVRVFRMTIQLLRQLRKALPPEYALHEALGLAIEQIHRDEVDARSQLELG